MYAGGKDEREANYLNSLGQKMQYVRSKTFSKCLAKENFTIYKYIFH